MAAPGSAGPGGKSTSLPQALGTLSTVPRISAFYGIVIAMYFDYHPPAHFHARYGEHEAQVSVSDGEVLNGTLPRRAHALVREWVGLHRAEWRRTGSWPVERSLWL